MQPSPNAIPGADADAERLRGRLADAERGSAATGGWAGLLREGLLARLREMVDTWDEVMTHGARLRADDPPAPPRSAPLRTPGHADPLLLALSGLGTALATALACAFWIGTAWPGGAGAAVMAGVATSIFAGLDDPAPAIAKFLTGSVLAVAVAAVYAFAVLPAIDGFPLLAFVLGVFYVPARAFQAIPSLLGLMLPLTLTVFTQLSLGETYNVDPQRFVENGIGTVVGLAFALQVTRLLRSPVVALRVRRLAAADRRDLARLAGERADDVRPIAADMLDRFEALSARLGAADERDGTAAELTGLRAAMNVVRLRECLPALAPPLHRPVREVLAALAAPDREEPDWEGNARDDVLTLLDTALRVSAAERDAAARTAALALSGLRMALFPRAAPPTLPVRARPVPAPVQAAA